MPTPASMFAPPPQSSLEAPVPDSPATGSVPPPPVIVSVPATSSPAPVAAMPTSSRRQTPSAPAAVATLATLREQAAAAHAEYLQFAEQFTATAAALLTAAPAATRVEPAESEESSLVLTREQCLEYAVGRIAAVFGPEFAEVDRFPTRVRLPDEPLMLVDRITALEGEPLSLSHGRVVTEHDILPGAWYLDNGRIPTCIAVEAGQADLLLSGYLGIDRRTRGLAVYRLLDAVVTFHRPMPGPGEVIRYDIRIKSFFRQGESHLFRFEFDATVGGALLLTMRDGCAGFFSESALAAGRGIVHTRLDQQPRPGKLPADWQPLVEVTPKIGRAHV